jgi:hypothetical protein
MPWESLPPFVIITAAVTLMGGIQSTVHQLYAGKPKAVNADTWDRLLEKRDDAIKAAAKARARADAKTGGRGTPVLGLLLLARVLAPQREPGHAAWQRTRRQAGVAACMRR